MISRGLLVLLLAMGVASASLSGQNTPRSFTVNGKPVSIASVVDAKGTTYVQIKDVATALSCSIGDFPMDDSVYRIERGADSASLEATGPHVVGFVLNNKNRYVALRQLTQALGCSIDADRKGLKIDLKADVERSISCYVMLEPVLPTPKNAKEARTLKPLKLKLIDTYLELADSWSSMGDSSAEGYGGLVTMYGLRRSSDYRLIALNYMARADRLRKEVSGASGR